MHDEARFRTNEERLKHREALRELSLQNAVVESSRFEELLSRPEMHEGVDLVTVRAVMGEVPEERTPGDGHAGDAEAGDPHTGVTVVDRNAPTFEQRVVEPQHHADATHEGEQRPEPVLGLPKRRGVLLGLQPARFRLVAGRAQRGAERRDEERRGQVQDAAHSLGDVPDGARTFIVPLAIRRAPSVPVRAFAISRREEARRTP